MLDAIDDRWEDAVALLDWIASLEAKLPAKLMRGLTIRIWADARARAGDPTRAFRAAMDRRLAKMPIRLIRNQLAMLRTMARVFTPEVCRKLIEEKIAPRIRNGMASFEQAHAIVFQRYAVKRLIPVGSVIDAVLARRKYRPIRPR